MLRRRVLLAAATTLAALLIGAAPAPAHHLPVIYNGSVPAATGAGEVDSRLDFGEHLSMPYDHIAARDVLNALDPAGAERPRCTPVAPGAGG